MAILSASLGERHYAIKPDLCPERIQNPEDQSVAVSAPGSTSPADDKKPLSSSPRGKCELRHWR
jgi:hypothetical protein